MFRKMVLHRYSYVFRRALGCTTFGEEHKGATTGAGIGAATGTVAGALLGAKGAKTEMAILGGLAGALAGGLIGHYAYDQKRTKEETAQKYNYNASQGPLLRIEDVSAVPATAKPGDTVEMKMTYALLGVGSGKEAALTETREIRYEGEMYGKPQKMCHAPMEHISPASRSRCRLTPKRESTALSRQCRVPMQAIRKK